MHRMADANWIDRLPPDAQKEVRAVMTRRRFKRGQPIYRGGDESDTIFQVVRGTVLFSELTADGRETLYGSGGPGACFGLAPAILGGSRIGTAVASEETELDCLSRTEFDRLRDRYSAIDRALLVWACEQMRDVIRALHELKSPDLGHRLASQIVLLLEYAGPGPDGGARDTLKITHEMLAASIGATRQGISKVLRGWSAAGLIQYRYGRFRVLDVQRLQRIARGGSGPDASGDL